MGAESRNNPLVKRIKKRRKSLENKPLVMMTEQELTATWDDLCHEVDVKMLEQARNKREARSHFQLAVVMLVHADGTRNAVFWTCEHGDKEGLNICVDFAESCQRQGLLNENEALEIRLLTRSFAGESLSCTSVDQAGVAHAGRHQQRKT